jgi:hypothetical protein
MSDEGECPFCAVPLSAWTPELPRAPQRGRLGRAAVLAAGAGATLIGACSSAVVEYGAPVLLDAGSMLDAADGATGGAGGRGSNASGGATGTGDGAGGASTKPDAGSVVPLYGAPARDGG